MQQLREHALNAIRVLAHIFQKQNATLDARKIGRAQQRSQHGQVAAPQCGFFYLKSGFNLDGYSTCRDGFRCLGRHLTVLPPACALPLSGDEVVKTSFHDVVGQHVSCSGVATGDIRLATHPKTLAQRGASPGDATRARQHGVLECCEVADTDKQHALRNGFFDGFVADAWQDAGQTIATA